MPHAKSQFSMTTIAGLLPSAAASLLHVPLPTRPLFPLSFFLLSWLTLLKISIWSSAALRQSTFFSQPLGRLEFLRFVAAAMALRAPWRRAVSLLGRPAVTPASLQQVNRGFAQERPEDSSTSNWGTGEPPIDEKATERGVSPGSEGDGKQGSESQDPNQSKQSTRDFVNAKRDERMSAAEGSKPVSEVDPEGAKLQEEVKRKGAPPAEMAGG